MDQGPPVTQAGFTYLGVLFLAAIAGTVAAGTGVMWSTAQQREKEQQLLFVGNEFRKAIGEYHERSPGSTKMYPAQLEDLLKDNRFLTTQRHLRRIYPDPLTGEREWGIVRAPEGGIMGVYSLSNAVPLKVSGFDGLDQPFEGARQYGDWRFVYVPPVAERR